MLCPDCELEVDHLVKSRGICNACYRRYQNSRYRKIDYVPLKDIKGTSEYNRAMGKRNGASKRKKSAKTKDYKIENVTMKKSMGIIDSVAREVNTDIENLFKEKGVDTNINYLPIEIMIEWLFNLCQEINYIGDLSLQKQLYDTLVSGYLHILKNPESDSFSTDDFANIGRKIKIIQDKRTPVDIELDKYNVIAPVFEFLQNNKDFKNLIQDCRIKLKKLLNDTESPVYKTNITSLQNYSFVEPTNSEKIRKLNLISSNSVSKRMHNYNIKILKVRNLYGNKNYTEFVYDKTISAVNEDEAKKNFLAFMRKDFSNVIFNESDVIVSEAIGKECL